MNTRLLNIDDYSQFHTLINDFRQTQFDMDTYKNMLQKIQKYSEIWVIENKDTGQLIATGKIILEDKFIFNTCVLGHIEDVCVKKEFRRNGLGKIIVDKLIERAREYKCYKITLDCSDDNIAFYIKSKFG